LTIPHFLSSYGLYVDFIPNIIRFVKSNVKQVVFCKLWKKSKNFWSGGTKGRKHRLNSNKEVIPMHLHDKHLDNEVIAAFVDEALPLTEREAATAHLASCQTCAALAKALYADRYALHRLRTPAPEGLAEAVMAKVGSVKPRRPRRFVYGTYAAAALLILVFGVYFGQNPKKSADSLHAPAELSVAEGKLQFYDTALNAASSHSDDLITKANSLEIGLLPPDALFPEAHVLLRMDAAALEASGLDWQNQTELMRIPSDSGGFLVAYAISAQEYAVLLPKGEVLRDQRPADTGKDLMYVLLVDLN
jgi:hypothetical protein